MLLTALHNSSTAIYDYLLSGGMAQLMVQQLENIINRGPLNPGLHYLLGADWTLEVIGQALRERPESRDFTVALLRRVGMVPQLLRIARQPLVNDDNDDAVSFSMGTSRASDHIRLKKKEICC